VLAKKENKKIALMVRAPGHWSLPFHIANALLNLNIAGVPNDHLTHLHDKKKAWHSCFLVINKKG